MDKIILVGCLFLFIAIFALIAYVIVSALVWFGGWFFVGAVIVATVALILIANWEASR